MTLRPDAFDIGLYPLKLVSGHISSLYVEGIAESFMGGPIKVEIEDCFLLFNIDTNIDVEQMHIMKKLLLEMKYETIAQTLWRELMQRIQGIAVGTPDFKKQRSAMFKMIKNVFKNINITVKSIHIRLEVPSKSTARGSHSCIALGCTLPLFTIKPNSTGGTTGLKGRISKNDHALSLALKSLQLYCDYDSLSYASHGTSHIQIFKEFQKRYSTEKHTGILQPFDMEIVVSADIKSKSGIVTPRVGINIPALRIACDPKQIEAFNDVLDLYIFALRRCNILLLAPCTSFVDKNVPPFVLDVSSLHILPALYIKGHRYPSEMKLPRSHVRGVKGYFHSLPGSWARHMWRFAIDIILKDLRLIRPLGRWIELVKLPVLRRKYAYFFSKLLKKTGENGDYMYDVKGKLDPTVLSQLYAMEMMLPIPTILMFRSFGVMVCVVKEFNDKYRIAHGIQKGSNAGDKSKLLQWKDIVRIHVEVLETYRALQREDDVDNMDDDEPDEFDDSVSALTDDASFFSSPYKGSKGQDGSGGSISKSFASLNLVSKAKNAFMKRKNSGLDALPEQHEDSDSDSHSKQSATPSKTPVVTSSSVISTPMGNISMPSLPTTQIRNLLNISTETKQQASTISEAIQWVIPRHQSLITIIPPDLYLTLGRFDCSFREEVINGARKNIATLSLGTFNGALTISSPVLGNNQDGSSFDKSVGGFASLAGALIQFRLTIETLKMQLFHHELPPAEESALAMESSGPRERLIKSYASNDALDSDSSSDGNTSVSASVSDLSKFYGTPSVAEESAAKVTPQNTPGGPQTALPVNVFLSEEKQQFLVLCVVLDNDIKKKGAADVQLQLGPAKVSLDGPTLASTVDGRSIIVINSKRASAAVKEHFQLLTLYAEKALVIDIESRVPLALMSLVSESEEVLEARNEAATIGGLVTKADHAAVVAHLNYEYWFTLLDEYMPKLVTINIRTSALVMEFLSANSIKDIINSKVQLKADKAAAFNSVGPRRRRSATYAKMMSRKSKKSKGTMMKALYDIRRWGFKEGELDQGRMQVEVNPFELVFAKSNASPYPMLIFDLIGGKVSIPIEDETLCHALAMFLAKEIPMFV
jgi:hypothetical protein